MRKMILKQKKQRNKKRLNTIPLSKLVPSMITILALCLGITSIRYAMDAKWTISFSLIFIAALLDGIDGRLARMLNATSGFGAQLDSLADVISFGVAPAIVMYLWTLHGIEIKGVGWSIVLLFIACSALRLARFNSSLTDSSENQKIASQFFTGMPMPVAGISALFPMLISFEFFDKDAISPWLVAAHMVIIALLMVSKVPTISIKTVHINRKHIAKILVVSTILFAALLLEPWVILPIVNILYIAGIPLSVIKYRKLIKELQ